MPNLVNLTFPPQSILSCTRFTKDEPVKDIYFIFGFMQGFKSKLLITYCIYLYSSYCWILFSVDYVKLGRRYLNCWCIGTFVLWLCRCIGPL